jgi:hypothetical protein
LQGLTALRLEAEREARSPERERLEAETEAQAEEAEEAETEEQLQVQDDKRTTCLLIVFCLLCLVINSLID